MTAPGYHPAHGNAAARGTRIVWEQPKSSEQATAPEGAGVAIERAGQGRFTSAGAAEAARRRWELAELPDYADFELALVAQEDWKPFELVRKANYQRALDDIVERTGRASRRVKTTLRGYAYLSASAEHWAAVFASTGDPAADDRSERRFKAASIEAQKAWDAACAEARNDDDEVVALDRQRAEFQRGAAERARAANEGTP